MANRVITEEILTAIRRWRDAEKLTYAQMGEVVGMKASAVCQWFNGRSKAMYEATFSRLYPHISKYLPPDFRPYQNSGALVINNGGTNYGNAVSHYAMSVVLRKITDNSDLTADEKIKFIKALQD